MKWLLSSVGDEQTGEQIPLAHLVRKLAGQDACCRLVRIDWVMPGAYNVMLFAVDLVRMDVNEIRKFQASIKAQTLC